jgi:hypothetical protein
MIFGFKFAIGFVGGIVAFIIGIVVVVNIIAWLAFFLALDRADRARQKEIECSSDSSLPSVS